jgi:cell division septum initiation protein DivIVA
MTRCAAAAAAPQMAAAAASHSGAVLAGTPAARGNTAHASAAAAATAAANRAATRSARRLRSACHGAARSQTFLNMRSTAPMGAPAACRC